MDLTTQRRLRPLTARPAGAASASWAIAGTVGLCLGLAACTSDETSPDPSEPATSADSPTESVTSPSADTGPAPVADPTACLVGTWAQDVEALGGALSEVTSMAGSDGTASVTGSATLVLDGTTATRQESLQQSATVTHEGAEVTTTLTSEGTQTGTYTVEGDTLTIAGVDASGVTATTVLTVGGRVVPAPDDPYEDFGGAATFTCDATTLTLIPLDNEVNYLEVYSRQ